MRHLLALNVGLEILMIATMDPTKIWMGNFWRTFGTLLWFYLRKKVNVDQNVALIHDWGLRPEKAKSGGHFGKVRLKNVFQLTSNPSLRYLLRRKLRTLNLKFWSLQSLDSPDNTIDVNGVDIIGSGDHENYFVKFDLNRYPIFHKNGSRLDADCKSIAVKIRAKWLQEYWPSIPKTTLTFVDADYSAGCYDFHKTVKPDYG